MTFNLVSHFRHRFFPLLKFMFEKCEMATSSPDQLATSWNKSYEQANIFSGFHRHGYHQASSAHEQTRNDMKNFDHELTIFLNENQHIIQRKDKETGDVLDEMVNCYYCY